LIERFEEKAYSDSRSARLSACCDIDGRTARQAADLLADLSARGANRSERFYNGKRAISKAQAKESSGGILRHLLLAIFI